MGDENPIYTIGDYSKPSHEGYRNTIELPVGNNVVRIFSKKDINKEKMDNAEHGNETSTKRAKPKTYPSSMDQPEPT
ncbi:hypothetical protein Tco_1144290 [Tanacetum coccineum]